MLYSGSGFRAFEVGDIDVVRHDGRFHLFHLVLPNHDFIAHAVSEDGLTWRRVDNALFVSNPGAFDDDMLWTMHVSPDPHGDGWRMFYTGLCLTDRGRVQRVGVARSDDLYGWEKVDGDHLPLQAAPGHYEHSADADRNWVSFRDPYFVEHNGRGALLIAARVDHGPIVRRGCVALATEEAPGRFELREPLFHPGRYDDIEVPSVFRIDDRYYLIGSIREDSKVHYWYADEFEGPYRNFSDNVLMPQGNYAARTCFDERTDALLVWSFFFKDGDIKADHLLPPPKEVAVVDGQLRLRSYRGFDDIVVRTRGLDELGPLRQLFGNPWCESEAERESWIIDTASGFEAFLVPGEHDDFRLSGTITVERPGKLGLVLNLDDEGDGYYISIDPAKGIAQIRYWAARPGGSVEDAFEYEQLQSSFHVPRPGPIPFELLSFGDYIELSLHGDVILTLADQRKTSGRVGVYLESARLRIDDLKLEDLRHPDTGVYVSPSPDLPGVEPTTDLG